MRDLRVLKNLLRVGILTVAVLAIVTLIGGTTAEATTCIGCPPSPGMPPVVCSDGHIYPNVCVAQANCQYDCVVFLRQD